MRVPAVQVHGVSEGPDVVSTTIGTILQYGITTVKCSLFYKIAPFEIKLSHQFVCQSGKELLQKDGALSGEG